MLRIFFLFYIFTVAHLYGQTPELSRLLAGNERFVQGKLLHPNRTEERRKMTKYGQEPFAVVVTCSDSRVAPEIIFDEGIGDLFVIRVAGNVIGPIEKESIEYAVEHLHSSLILVLGHENCGAVDAVLHNHVQDIPEIAHLIAPSIQQLKYKNRASSLPLAVKGNAMRMKNMLSQDPSFKRLIAKKKLHTFAGYYHFKTGRVEILD